MSKRPPMSEAVLAARVKEALATIPCGCRVSDARPIGGLLLCAEHWKEAYDVLPVLRDKERPRAA